jgi:xylan 1,4-beta-xylosidase
MVWDEESGWPRFINGTNASEIAPVPFTNTVQFREAVYYDDFSTGMNLRNWQWDLNKGKPEMKLRRGRLELSSKEKDYVFTGISPKTGNFIFDAGVNAGNNLESGICIYGNSNHILALTVRENQLVLFLIKNGVKEKLAEKKIKGSSNLTLRIESENGRYFKFHYSEKGNEWIAIDAIPESGIDGHFLPQWGAAVRAGLLIKGADRGKAIYNYIRMENKFR